MKSLLFCSGLILISFLFPAPSEARVGETRSTIEGRLFASGGIVYRDEDSRASKRKSKPYEKYFQFMPSTTEMRVYFKTADGRKPKASELEGRSKLPGWDLHVVFIDGKSVIEVYERTGGMSEFELNHLLAVNGGGSYWTKVKDKPKAEGEDEEVFSAFGFDMVRADGAVRAKHSGGTLLLVDTKLDESLAKMKESSLQERAPVSVQGF